MVISVSSRQSSRPACVAGALFLLLVYLSMPPFPGLPDNLKAEGHYFIVNKNLIEMLALLTLSTTFSGRWLGLDYFTYALFGKHTLDED